MNNQHNLPQWLVDSVVYLRNKYNPGEKTDYSATTLLKPPMMYALEIEHKDELESDVADGLASFLGTAYHDAVEAALEDKERYVVEERFYREIHVPDAPDKKDFIVSAQLDLFDKEIKELSDHKVVQVGKLTFGDKFDWEFQLNMGRWLLQHHGYEVESLKINAFLKDWRRGELKKAKLTNSYYPPTAFVQVHIPFWSDEDVETYIRTQIVEKELAKRGVFRWCTDEERWKRPSVWKVFKPGGKRSMKNCSSEDEAIEFVDGRNLSVVEYEGEAVRCEQGWCQVAAWCPQLKAEKK